ncbi:hypothetical protein DF186_24775, partial [Enterococcus hirae]
LVGEAADDQAVDAPVDIGLDVLADAGFVELEILRQRRERGSVEVADPLSGPALGLGAGEFGHVVSSGAAAAAGRATF